MMRLRRGKFGPFFSCANYPRCKQMTAPEIACPDCGTNMVIREGKYGLFYGCPEYPRCTGLQSADDYGYPKGTAVKSHVRKLRRDLLHALKTEGTARDILIDAGFKSLKVNCMGEAECLKALKVLGVYRPPWWERLELELF